MFVLVLADRSVFHPSVMLSDNRYAQKRYASVFALYDIVNMDDIFGWHGNFIKSCSIRIL